MKLPRDTFLWFVLILAAGVLEIALLTVAYSAGYTEAANRWTPAVMRSAVEDESYP